MRKMIKWFSGGVTPSQVLKAVVLLIAIAFIASIKLEITLCDGCGKLLIKTITSLVGYHES